MIRRLNFQPHIWTSRERDWRFNHQRPMIYQPCLRDETSMKTLNKGVQRASGIVNTSKCHNSGEPLTLRDRSSCDQDPSGSCSMYLFIWLYTCVLYKLVRISKVFPWILWAITANSETWGGAQGISNLQPHWTEVRVSWEFIYMRLASEVGGGKGGSLVGPKP